MAETTDEHPIDFYDLEVSKGEVNKKLNKLLQRATYQRYHFERQWFQAVNYYAGNHWMIWDRTRRQFRNRRTPRWWPQHVTNVFAEKIDDNIASLLQRPPQLSWLPETDDPADIATAQIADRIDETIADETKRVRDARQLATWMTLCGSAFVESFYDNSEENGMAFLQFVECKDCGVVGMPSQFHEANSHCPNCESERLKEAYQRIGASCQECGMIAQAGSAYEPCPRCLEEQMRTGVVSAPPPMLEPVHSEEPLGQKVPRGRVGQRIRSPFEVFFDHFAVRDFTKEGGLKEVLIVELMDKGEAKTLYGEQDISSAGTSVGTSLSMLYLETLSVLSNASDTQSGQSDTTVRGGYSGRTDDWVLRETRYALPEQDSPQGAMTVRVNGSSGKIVEHGPLPYEDTNDVPFIPIVHFRFKYQPGRVWGKTVATDLIPLQDQRNQSENMMILCERRAANPVWVLPSNIVDRAPSGQPGEVVWYKPWGAGTTGRQPIPQRQPGVDPPQYFQHRMAQLDDAMEKLSGSYGVAHGEAPKGITAASALALLGERQQRQVAPQIHGWEMGHETVGYQQMMIFRKFGVDPRIHMRLGPDKLWQIDKWSNADLTGKVTVSVEFGSASPKSAAQERAQIEGLVNMGVADISDPQIRRKVLQKFGESDLIENLEVDSLYAQKENDRFMGLVKGRADGELPELREIFDNHGVHVIEHINLGKTEEYRRLRRRANRGDEEIKFLLERFEEHLMGHMKILEDEAEKEMAREAEMAQIGKGPEGPGAGRPPGGGKVFDRGIRAPEEERSRTVLEPQPLTAS